VHQVRRGLGERLAGLAGIDPKRAALLGELGRRAASAIDAVQPHLRTARELRDRWAGSPLFFLLRRLPVAQAGQLLRLVDEAGEEIVVELAAPVLMRSAIVQVIHEELLFVRTLPEAVRRQIVHGLEHVRAGEWEDACPPLVISLQELARLDAQQGDGAPSGQDGNLPAVRPEASPPAIRLSPGVRRRMLERAGSWARDAFAQGRTSQTFRLGGDARRQSVYLTAEVIRWLERRGLHLSAELFIRELAGAVRAERIRRHPAARQLVDGALPALEPPASSTDS
jgi:hypothetical protein